MDEEKRGSSKRGAKIADLESGSLVVPPAQVIIVMLSPEVFLLQIQKRGGNFLHFKSPSPRAGSLILDS